MKLAKKITTAAALAAMVPAGCVPVPVVGLICWRCRWAWSALAPFPLAVLHPGRFWTFAGGVRFSTLPGSALGVGLELSEL